MWRSGVVRAKLVTEEKIDAPSGVVFIDIVTSFEKMGDHSFNVVEATAGIK